MGPRKAAPNRNGKTTTEKQYKQAFNKWWIFFCELKNMEHAVPTFVDGKGGITDESNVLFCEFAKFMSAQPGMTINIWKTHSIGCNLSWEIKWEHATNLDQ